MFKGDCSHSVSAVDRPETPAERAHIVFLSLGLRHLPVIDENSTVQGIVTRKDLDHVADVGPWRRNKASEKATTVREGSTSSAVRLAQGIIHSFSFTPHRSPSEQPLLGSDTEGAPLPTHLFGQCGVSNDCKLPNFLTLFGTLNPEV